MTRKGLAFNHSYNTNTPIEFQIAEVYATNNKKWNIVNVYNPCLSLVESHLNAIMEKMDKYFVLCGDLNGHNPLWGGGG